MVGPNGSGKSNVIDAMLFVFGKRAKQVYFNLMFAEFYCNFGFYLIKRKRIIILRKKIGNIPLNFFFGLV